MIFGSLKAKRMMGLDIGTNSAIKGISKTMEIVMIWMMIWTLLNKKILVFKVKMISRFIWSRKRR
jgi:hypothetical protein